MSKGSSKDKIEMIADSAGDGFISIAKRLREIQDESPESFVSVAEFMGIGLRKAYDLAKIDRTFSALGVDEKRLAAIGWSKVRLLCEHAEESILEELLILAEQCTARELAMYLKQDFPSPGMKSVLFYLEPKNYEVLEKVLVAYGAIKVGRGLIDKEDALLRALSDLKI